jgi:hypothetical protein
VRKVWVVSDETYCCAAQHGMALEVTVTTCTIIRLCRDLHLCTEHVKQVVKNSFACSTTYKDASLKASTASTARCLYPSELPAHKCDGRSDHQISGNILACANSMHSAFSKRASKSLIIGWWNLFPGELLPVV